MFMPHVLARLRLVPLVLALMIMQPQPAPAATAPAALTPTAYLPLVTKNAGGPTLAGCAIFPPDNPWNTDISKYPLHPNSDGFIASINLTSNNYLQAAFSTDPNSGIPFIVVPASQPFVPVTFTKYPTQSDSGPYPIPSNAPIEYGSDAHVLVLQQGACKLYEMFQASPGPNGSWYAGSGAIWDLSSNALRPEGWTSADAAGLPILPGLARYDEVAAGAINHALRFSVGCSQKGYIHPATHVSAKNTAQCPNPPPMGLRLRLKASYDISGYYGQARVVLEALKRYGLIVADNGPSWYITGASDPRWSNADLRQIRQVPGVALEAVYTGDIIIPP